MGWSISPAIYVVNFRNGRVKRCRESRFVLLTRACPAPDNGFSGSDGDSDVSFAYSATTNAAHKLLIAHSSRGCVTRCHLA